MHNRLKIQVSIDLSKSIDVKSGMQVFDESSNSIFGTTKTILEL